MIRKKKMTKDHDIIELKKLSGRQLDEFCTYWNSGPVHDGRKQKTKGISVEKDRDYRKDFYRQHLLSDGWAVYRHKHDDLLMLSENGALRLKGNAEEILGLLNNLLKLPTRLSNEKPYKQ